ncbi:hypothetical protein [Polymorphum gilvum]|uniref:Lipoprotein n=1 Tax=Polymorphum gilvum (strain LMG 25793 / CGMCC 1.9160 / SL003B-26A1) TaxID=991905 RepID=F2IZA0_POLGS|nr:hypothetical protein [Polymorphum gilvum]ADZ71823.1 hypothetical protein SL003B_3401 [Polymorphum gilvum SL003B-26A1]
MIQGPESSAGRVRPAGGGARLRRVAKGLAGAALMLAASGAVLAQEAGRPAIQTNQAYVDSLPGDAAAIDFADPVAVFRHVFSGLDGEVTVYPTENYFYYRFLHRGVRYAGNIRLDVLDRDDGWLHFAYFRDYTEWSSSEPVSYRRLGPQDGIAVTRLAPLRYAVAFEGRTVVFQLNDLAGVRPPEGLIRADETYIGPVHDESGIRFFALYNRTIKAFQYLLDESVPVLDVLEPSAISPDILIGVRTGFAFHRDKYRDRKILIGVFEGNANVNNYFDGPFDQLPDNFLADGRLREAILDIEPDLAGTIDRYGNSNGGAERYFIGSYLHYRYHDDLAVFSDCAADTSLPEELYYGCFSIDEGPDGLTAGEVDR